MIISLSRALRTNKKRLAEMYRLDVRCEMKFRGEDARAARRWLYDFLRRYPMLFANFDGPRDPIEMTFLTGSGYWVEDLTNDLFLALPFEDVETRVTYQSLNPDELEHHGSFKVGHRKKGFLGVFTPRDTETGQQKI